MTIICAWKGCTSSKSKNPNLTFHRFPKDEATRMKWIERCGNPALTYKSKVQMLSVRICCLHFSGDDIIPFGKQGKWTLRSAALPSDAADTAPLITSNVLTCLGVPSTTSAETSAFTTSANACAFTTAAETSAYTSAAVTTLSTTTTANTSPVISSGVSNKGSVSVIRLKKIIDESTLKKLKLKRLVKLRIAALPNGEAVTAPVVTNAVTCHAMTSTTSANASAFTTSELTTAASPTSPTTTTANTSSVSSFGVSLIRRKNKIREPTPKEEKLQRLVKLLRLEIKKQNQKIKRLETKLEKNASDVAFAKAAYDLNDDVLAFFKMQVDHVKKRPWTEDEKLFALSLYYKSSSAYNYLKDVKHFALPCITLLRSWMNDQKDLELAS